MKKIILVLLSILMVGMVVLSGCQKSDVAGEEGALAGEAIAERTSLPIRPTEGVTKNELFVLNIAGNQNEILQYKGADKNTMTSPKIKFKLISSGETLEYALTGGSATIRLMGNSYQVGVLRPNVIDSPINVDYDGDGVIDATHSKTTFHLKGLLDLAGVYYEQPVTCTEVKTLLEGESVAVESLGISSLILTSVDAEKAKVNIDGRSEEFIALGRASLVGVTNVHVLGILFQDYAGGIHQATLCLR